MPDLQLFTIILGTISLLWLSILTTLYWQSIRSYSKLTKNVKGKDLADLWEKHLERIGKLSDDLDRLEALVLELKDDGQLHVQKMGVIRFNPFQEVGGNQSFAISMLDGHGNGMVISSLYSREGTRIFGKPVRNGKATEHKFSSEEAEAVKKALS